MNRYERLKISLFMRVVCINLVGHWSGAGEWGAVEKCSQAAYPLQNGEKALPSLWSTARHHCL